MFFLYSPVTRNPIHIGDALYVEGCLYRVLDIFPPTLDIPEGMVHVCLYHDKNQDFFFTPYDLNVEIVEELPTLGFVILCISAAIMLAAMFLIFAPAEAAEPPIIPTIAPMHWTT